MHQYNTIHINTIIQNLNTIMCKVIAFLFIILSASAFTDRITELDKAIQYYQSIGQIYQMHRNRFNPCKEMGGQVEYQQQGQVEYQQQSLFGMHPYGLGNKIQMNTCVMGRGQIMSMHTISTNQHTYVLLSMKDTISLFTTECQLIAKHNNMIGEIQRVICDKGTCGGGIVYLSSSNGSIWSLTEERGWEINKIVQPSQSTVGTIIRGKGSDKIQIFTAYEDGTVRVFDQSGHNKLTISVELPINCSIVNMVDHHPYPILFTSCSWLTYIDPTKYLTFPSPCPSMPTLHTIITASPYDSMLIAVSQSKIHQVQFQGGKKACKINEIGGGLDLKKYKSNTINTNDNTRLESNRQERYRFEMGDGCIWADGVVFNISEGKWYKRIDTVQFDSNISQCTHRNERIFLSRKSNDNSPHLHLCCSSPRQCIVSSLTINKSVEDRSTLFYLTLIFILILFLAVRFMKRSSPQFMRFQEQDQRLRKGRRSIEEQVSQMLRAKK